MTDEFEPRLGRVGDRGRAGQARYARRVRQAAARAGKPAGKVRFSGAGIGRGAASAHALDSRPRRLPDQRMRRVIVKTSISRARQAGGSGALKAHLDYIRRDGVERDGSGGEVYTREAITADAEGFAGRCEGDRHHFRLIVSAEDGAELGDLKETTRALMAQMESDLGTRLDWLAVDHHNTGHPHTHIVIRGKDGRGKDLVISPDYIQRGLAARARDIVTQKLGPRRDIEIAQARQKQVTQDRFTAIDRAIQADAPDGHVRVSEASGPAARFEQALRRARLRHLGGLNLAQSTGRDTWQLRPGWDRALAELGRRGDVIRALAARFREQEPGHTLQRFEPGAGASDHLTGTVLTTLPDDELRDRRCLVVEDFHGQRWMVDIGLREPGTMPRDGAVVEVGAKTPKLREIDASIGRIVARSGGLYSDALHRDADPTSSPAWREGHVRRLEAMRRAGITERRADGIWHVPPDYAAKALQQDTVRAGRLALEVRSWLPLQDQVRYPGLTWLDQEPGRNPGARLAAMREARAEFLRAKGWLEPGLSAPDAALRSRLREMDLKRASAVLAGASRRQVVTLSQGETFEGRFEKAVDLGQGRFALIGNTKEFALVPWRPDLERHRGRDLTIRRTERGVSWTIGRTRGPER